MFNCPTCNFSTNTGGDYAAHARTHNPIHNSDAFNKMPPSQGKRDKIRPRYDLIPKEFLDELASIFEEGQKPRPGMPEGYGDSWKAGGTDFIRDCKNHAMDHLLNHNNGDRSENHLAKVAWNCLVVRYFEKEQDEKNNEPMPPASPTKNLPL